MLRLAYPHSSLGEWKASKPPLAKSFACKAAPSGAATELDYQFVHYEPDEVVYSNLWTVMLQPPFRRQITLRCCGLRQKPCRLSC